MAHGIKLRGTNNSLPVSSFGASLIFRGKAQRRTNAGDTFYPADAVFNDMSVRSFFRTCSFDVIRPSGAAGVTRHFKEQLGTAIGDTKNLVNQGTPAKNIVILTYQIPSPTLPVVFCASSTNNTTAAVLGIVQEGVLNGVPLWIIKVNTSFPLGTAESTIVSRITLYCFSTITDADLSPTFGVRTFTSTGQVAFSSERIPLRVKDFVVLESSSTPSNLADIIYSRTFSPEPETSMFQLSKPAFMNVDFARYASSQYVGFSTVYQGFISRRERYLNWHYRLISYLATTGINLVNNDINISLSVIDAEWNAFDFDSCNERQWSNFSFSSSMPPPPPSLPNQFIVYKKELFPCTIPVIEGADYD